MAGGVESTVHGLKLFDQPVEVTLQPAGGEAAADFGRRVHAALQIGGVGEITGLHLGVQQRQEIAPEVDLVPFL